MNHDSGCFPMVRAPGRKGWFLCGFLTHEGFLLSSCIHHTFQIGNQCIKELIETFPFIANWISMVSCSGHLLDETVRMCRQVVAPKSFFFELICDISVECSRKHLTGTAPVAMSALSVNLIKLIRCYIKVGKGSIFFPL